MRIWSFSSIALAAVLLVPVWAYADKLKGFYSGSGGVTQEVHRVVMIEFGADGTALVQQNWVGKDPQTWHAHWTQEGELVTVKFDAVKDKPAIDPLVFDFKHGSLTPTSWDATALGVLGPPKLAPSHFSPGATRRHSTSSRNFSRPLPASGSTWAPAAPEWL